MIQTRNSASESENNGERPSDGGTSSSPPSIKGEL